MTLQLGSSGSDVLILQYHLTMAGFPTATSATFDHETLKSVSGFQLAKDLPGDGIFGPNAREALSRALTPHPPTPAMFVNAAEALGVSIPTIQAVAEVESNGTGFLASGRPTILFERHVFYRRLAAHGFDPALLAKHFPWIVTNVSGGYSGGESEHLRLRQAMDLHTPAACEAASWGAFQIMGYHWKPMGYAGVQDFVAHMREGYAQHLVAFVRFIAADGGLRSALAKRDWADFARRYNGPSYAKNAYDVKLAKAYERLVRTQHKALNN